MTDDAIVEHVEAGLSGHIAGFNVFISGDTVTILEDVEDAEQVQEEVDGLAEFVEDAEEFRLGWAELPDGEEVVYLYDRADGCFGYAVNLSVSMFSEWGYAPFESSG